MTQPVNINWNPTMLERFIKAYNQNVSEDRECFNFEGNDFVVGYARYLIEFLDGQFNQNQNEKNIAGNRSGPGNQ